MHLAVRVLLQLSSAFTLYSSLCIHLFLLTSKATTACLMDCYSSKCKSVVFCFLYPLWINLVMYWADLYEFVYRCCSCDFDDIFVSAVDHFAAADGMYSSLLAAWHGSSIVRHIGKVTVHRSGLYCDGWPSLGRYTISVCNQPWLQCFDTVGWATGRASGL